MHVCATEAKNTTESIKLPVLTHMETLSFCILMLFTMQRLCSLEENVEHACVYSVNILLLYLHLQLLQQ